jgi:hypothetical protein
MKISNITAYPLSPLCCVERVHSLVVPSRTTWMALS